ncbi:MAG: helix-turn-helix transcriptional regulator [Lachnospiraceae bacterium]|nr:helix-turn-helix transcriptional regulator [Lachnospiraceae bacterium]
MSYERNERYGSDEEMIGDMAEVFRVFGDRTRLLILMALSTKEECVGDLTEELGMTQSAVSHHLTILRQSRLVKTRREGKSIFYSLADDHVEDILNIGLEHINE